MVTFKVGDKFRVVSTNKHEVDRIKAGCILEFSRQNHPLGFMATDTDGDLWYVKTKDMTGSSDIIVEKITTETEAERRGAKFGVMGVYTPRSQKMSFVAVDCKNAPDPYPSKERWLVVLDGGINGRNDIFTVYAESVRFDHEPEFIPWVDAPEELKWDASRVYCDGKPVKWIAKPEGAFVDVAVVLEHGLMEFSTHNLTVKL